MSEAKPTGLALLRAPFPAHQISKLPKATKAQNESPDKAQCKECGGWHHPKVIHLDYVGHAALTDRLLDADPLWYWEPLALKDGLPAFDSTGGLWIRLHVCGHSRIGYGHAASSTWKEIGAREKEVIGDALRNAAMRFGAALELWHKGEYLHAPPTADEEAKEAVAEHSRKAEAAAEVQMADPDFKKMVAGATSRLKEAANRGSDALQAEWNSIGKDDTAKEIRAAIQAKEGGKWLTAIRAQAKAMEARDA